jgi:DNA-directed RNA polymerase I subunit RPA2
MCQKLFSFVENKCKPESADSVMMQESLLAGHLYLQVLQDKMERWLMLLRSVITKKAQSLTFKLTTGTITSLDAAHSSPKFSLFR